MAQRTETDELLAAWRALVGKAESEGWRTIPVAIGGPCQLRAGRHFPGNEEALLVRFASGRVPPVDHFPQGRGFLVSAVHFSDDNHPCVWIALCRQNPGSLVFFTMMAADIVSTLQDHSGCKDERLIQVFLARIRAWQEFMRRCADGLLSPEAEIGLVGEIEVLQELITAGLPPTIAVEAWHGPLDGLHDFVLGTGAIEVKTTASPSRFTIVVTSLEQLDDSLVRPLFLACIRLTREPSGKTLPEIVSDMRGRLKEEPAAMAGFDSRLLHAGYHDVFADRFTRGFSCTDIRHVTVNDDFPRLTQATVPVGIVKANYEIDLNLVAANNVRLIEALGHLGVM